MRKINTRHAELIKEALLYKFDIQYLREKKYTLAHALRILRHIKKQTVKQAGDTVSYIEILYPKKFHYENLDMYIADLKASGLKIRTWPEDFVDEDTGEVVTIKRHCFQPFPKIK
jgi:predicted small secreted protein